MQAGEYIQSQIAIPVTIFWHENRSSYLSFKRERKAIYLRLHRLFQDAPAPVLDALARYIAKNDISARLLIRKAALAYFSSHRAPSDSSYTTGLVYDLKEIYEKIKADFFGSEYDASIGWQAAPRGGRYRHITFGTYDRHRHQIRIHPFLDSAEVPQYFIEFIVYHEMLHAVCPAIIDARGACRSHTAEFRRRERLFPKYREAKEWEKQSLMFFKKRKFHGRS